MISRCHADRRVLIVPVDNGYPSRRVTIGDIVGAINRYRLSSRMRAPTKVLISLSVISVGSAGFLLLRTPSRPDKQGAAKERPSDAAEFETVRAPKREERPVFTGTDSFRLATAENSSSIEAETGPSEPPAVSRFEEMLQSHRSESRDLNWASKTERLIASDIAAIAGVTLLSLDCRDESCVARVRWPATASADHFRFAERMYQANCATAVRRDDAAFTAELMFLCGQWKQEGNPSPANAN